MLEFKSYREINLDETPIVVLSCGHPFTAETLDGHMQMSEVYELLPATGEYTGLHENIESLAPAPPRCPDCKRTVRQFATQRYNRAINRAVIDQMSKRFLVSGSERIQNLDADIDEIEEGLQKANQQVMTPEQGQSNRGLRPFLVRLREMEKGARKICTCIEIFSEQVADHCQPARKLHDATINAMQSAEAFNVTIMQLSINNKPRAPAPRDR